MRDAVGVVGGLGPMATVYFMERVIDLTVADTDQEHVDMLVWQQGSIPDRTAFLTGQDDADPLPAMVHAARTLQAGGARMLVMPCNTAHFFYDRLVASVSVPFLNIVEVTLDEARRRVPGLTTIGVLATDGTVHTETYQRAAERAGLDCVMPEPQMQAEVMDMIYAGVKAGEPVAPERFHAAVDHLRRRAAQVVVLGCTELSILQRDLAAYQPDIVDSVDALARATILAAGKQIRGTD